MNLAELAAMELENEWFRQTTQETALVYSVDRNLSGPPMIKTAPL